MRGIRENHIQEDVTRALVGGFQIDYGIDHGTADLLFRSGGPLLVMLEHMYSRVMEDLLDEPDLAGDGMRLQGQARMLDALLHVPKELEKMKELDL